MSNVYRIFLDAFIVCNVDVQGCIKNILRVNQRSITPTQKEGGLIFKEREGVGWNEKLGINFAMLRIA